MLCRSYRAEFSSFHTLVWYALRMRHIQKAKTMRTIFIYIYVSPLPTQPPPPPLGVVVVLIKGGEYTASSVYTQCCWPYVAYRYSIRRVDKSKENRICLLRANDANTTMSNDDNLPLINSLYTHRAYAALTQFTFGFIGLCLNNYKHEKV